MKTATVADLRNRFPRVFKWIEEGEQVELTKRGKVVARIVPALSSKPPKFKVPDFTSIRREIYGANPSELTTEDSAFIRERGER